MAASPYETLGVNPKAKQDEIKSAYRKLAKTFHPDLIREIKKLKVDSRISLQLTTRSEAPKIAKSLIAAKLKPKRHSKIEPGLAAHSILKPKLGADATRASSKAWMKIS